jgi:hypothetical protein
MEVKIPIAISINEKDLQAKIEQEARTTAIQIINSQFNDGKYSGTKGIAYGAVEETVTALICSDAAVTKISKIVEANWDRILEEAVLKALEHKANKIAFPLIKSSKLPIENKHEHNN